MGLEDFRLQQALDRMTERIGSNHMRRPAVPLLWTASGIFTLSVDGGCAHRKVMHQDLCPWVGPASGP